MEATAAKLNRDRKEIKSIKKDDAGATGETVKIVRGARRIVYWFLAGFFFLLALVGVVLPGIPTTPFLLLMCYFLIRVSPELHARVLTWPVVGIPLRDWREQRGVRRNVKFVACSMVLLLVGPTLMWSALSDSAKLLILCLAIYGISIVIRLPTARGRTNRSA